MVSEVAPRVHVRVFCPVIGQEVEHIVLSLDTGETMHWCQHCYEVLDQAAWDRRLCTGQR